MLKLRISILLIGLALYLSTHASVSAQCKKVRAEDFTAIARENLRKLGTGKEARVTLKLLDNTKLEGSISNVANSYFVITDDLTQVATKIAYTRIARAQGYNRPTYVLVCREGHC